MGRLLRFREESTRNCTLHKLDYFVKIYFQLDQNFGETVPKMPGMKFDKEKPRWDLLPLDAVEKIVEIMTYGAVKYKPNNWQKVEAWRYKAALLRHLVAIYKGEEYDQESGMLHIAHIGCNVLFLIWKKLHEEEQCE